MDSDPFDSLLDLENGFYEEGYKLGLKDGVIAGKVEGRLLGLENAFDKFVGLGQLHGRAVVWSARLDPAKYKPERKSEGECTTTVTTNALQGGTVTVLPPLSKAPRLGKHIENLEALANPHNMPIVNTESAGTDIENRHKKAATKARLIEKLIREPGETTQATEFTFNNRSGKSDSKMASHDNNNIEDISGLQIAY